MADYCAETDIEAYMLESITASSTPTTTQVAALITRASRMVDSVARVAASDFTASPPPYVAQATISACMLLIDNLREKDPEKRHPESEIIDTIRNWLNTGLGTVWGYSTATARDNDKNYLG